MHPLYPVANRLVGRHVIAHHINGRTYSGHLMSVHQHGIYLLRNTNQVISMSDCEESLVLTLKANAMQDDVDFVYAPAAYFGFGALTGLTLGALAGRYYW